MVEFTAEPETVAALDRMLGLADEVVRHKIVRLPDHKAPAQRPNPRPAERPGERSKCRPDNSVTLVGNVTRDPELHTQHRPGQCHLRPGGEPPLAEPPDPGVGGGHLLLRRGLLAARWPRTSARRSPGALGSCWLPAASSSAAGRPRKGDRTPRSRWLPDEIELHAITALGHGPDHWGERAAPAEYSRGGGGGGGGHPAAAPPATTPCGGCRTGLRIRRGALPVAHGTTSAAGTDVTALRTSAAGSRRSPARSAATRTEWVGYKDVPMLRKYAGDRGKIRAAPGDEQLRPAPAGPRHGHQDGARARSCCPTRSAR